MSEDGETAIRDGPGAVPITLFIDRDVLEWFRSSGEPYQTRINAVLRAYMEHERGKSRR